MANLSNKILTDVLQRKVKLTGKKGVLKVNDESLLDNYPFTPAKSIPVNVVSETPYFLTCIVLPHKNPSPMSCGISKEYTITVDKFNLFVKRMEIVPN